MIPQLRGFLQVPGQSVDLGLINRKGCELLMLPDTAGVTGAWPFRCFQLSDTVRCDIPLFPIIRHCAL